jgi:uncharacterized membrane protein (Fun14 family)
MDTNDLKSIWKKHTDKKVEEDKLNEDELNRIKYSKSKSMIQKIKNGIIFELLVSAIMVIIISYYLIKDLHIVIEISIVFLDIVFIFLLGVYFQYLRTIQKHKIHSINLKENLKLLIEEIERILKFLYLVSVAIIPIAAVFSYIVGFFIGAGEDASNVFSSTKNLILFPTIIGIATLIGFPLTKWYLQFMYGRHLNKLKRTLKELSQEENEEISIV